VVKNKVAPVKAGDFDISTEASRARARSSNLVPSTTSSTSPALVQLRAASDRQGQGQSPRVPAEPRKCAGIEKGSREAPSRRAAPPSANSGPRPPGVTTPPKTRRARAGRSLFLRGLAIWRGAAQRHRLRPQAWHRMPSRPTSGRCRRARARKSFRIAVHRGAGRSRGDARRGPRQQNCARAVLRSAGPRGGRHSRDTELQRAREVCARSSERRRDGRALAQMRFLPRGSMPTWSPGGRLGATRTKCALRRAIGPTGARVV